MKKPDYLKDLEKCVKCGSCKAYCPTYDEAETEAMSARGRLVLLRDLMLHRLQPSPQLNDKIFSCILCEACSGLCPSGVDITEQIYRGRTILRQTDKGRHKIRLLMRVLMRKPELSFKLCRILQYILSPYFARKGFIPPDFKLPDSSFKNSKGIYKPPSPKGRIAIFAGCSTNFLFPHLGMSLVNILFKAGYEVIVPRGEVCCGMPLRTLGMEEEAVKLAKKNMRIFGKLNVEAVLSPCPACVLALKKEYPKLIGSGLDTAMDVSSFLLDRLELKEKPLIKKNPAKVTYHDPCHLVYGLGVKKQPRELLGKIGIDIIEKKEGCCGYGGVFSLSNMEISRSLLEKQTNNLLKTGAKAVITACPGCMLHLSKTIIRTPILHIVELVEEAYCGREGAQ